MTTPSAGAGQGPQAPPSVPPDEPVDARPHVAALRRHRGLICLVVAAVTLTALAVSLASPSRYTATAKVTVNSAGTSEPTDAESVKRRLATMQTLATTPAVLADAARRLGGVGERTLERTVEVTPEPDADILAVSATAATAGRAAATANAAAQAFLAARLGAIRSQQAAQRAALERALAGVRGTSPQATVTRDALGATLSDLEASRIVPGGGVLLAEPARPPSAASSPHPLRTTFVALVAAILLAVLLALAVDRARPVLGGVHELAQVTGLRVLAALPARRDSRWAANADALLARAPEPARPRLAPLRRRLADGRAERDRRASAREDAAFQAAAALLMGRRRTRGATVVLVTGATPGDASAAVTLGLGRALARAGRGTLLIAGDLRSRQLETAAGRRTGRGLADLLAREPSNDDLAAAVVALRAADPACAAPLHLLGTGRRGTRGAVTADRLAPVVRAARAARYECILLEAPPVLASPEAQVMADECDAVVVVTWPERLPLAQAQQLAQALTALPAEAAGVFAAPPAGPEGELAGAAGRAHRQRARARADAGRRVAPSATDGRAAAAPDRAAVPAATGALDTQAP